MNAPGKIAAEITAPLDAETAALVDRLASTRNMTTAEYAAEAIRRVAESEADFEAFIQVGIDAADRGDLIDHGDMMRELDTMIAAHRTR